MQIVHATSTGRLGPWKRQGALKPFGSTSICAHALRDPASKKYLIFHTGCGNHSNPNSEGYGTNHSTEITNCKNGTTPDDAGPGKNKQTYAPPPPGYPHNRQPAPGNATCGVVSCLVILPAPSSLCPG